MRGIRRKLLAVHNLAIGQSNKVVSSTNCKAAKKIALLANQFALLLIAGCQEEKQRATQQDGIKAVGRARDTVVVILRGRHTNP